MYVEKRNRNTARAEAATELSAATAQRALDLLEYVAMMADVDLPYEEDEADEQDV